MLKTLILTGNLVIALFALNASASAQDVKGSRPKPGTSVEMGRGMSVMNTGLLRIASQTGLFLDMSAELQLTEEQKLKLSEIFFDNERLATLKVADLQVNEAELQRLLSQESIDLVGIKQKLKENGQLKADLTYQSIVAALRAIEVLTHDQHVKAMIIVRGTPKATLPEG